MPHLVEPPPDFAESPRLTKPNYALSIHRTAGSRCRSRCDGGVRCIRQEPKLAFQQWPQMECQIAKVVVEPASVSISDGLNINPDAHLRANRFPGIRRVFQ